MIFDSQLTGHVFVQKGTKYFENTFARFPRGYSPLKVVSEILLLDMFLMAICAALISG